MLTRFSERNFDQSRYTGIYFFHPEIVFVVLFAFMNSLYYLSYFLFKRVLHIQLNVDKQFLFSVFVFAFPFVKSLYMH